MKKVVNITIGGIVFSIEEDAYTTLSEYLTTVRNHFKDSDESGEIVDDIELSIAEKFGKKKKSEVIGLADVETIISEMGTIEDFKKELSDMEASEVEDFESMGKTKKKLYRNVDDQIIAGVASGIAAYFGVDPVFVRLLFVLSIFLNGLGILVYIVLWVVMPPAETVAQKLEMQGDPVTLQQFEKMVKDKIPSDAKERTSAFVRFLEIPFEFLKGVLRALGSIVRNIGPALRILIGVFITLVSAGIALALTIALTGVHFSINAGLFELPVREFMTFAEYITGLGALYLLFLIPSAIGVILGVSILKKANKFTGMLLGGFALVWFGSLFAAGHAASTIVPQYQSYVDSMPVIAQEHELDEFSEVTISSGDRVVIKKGDTYSISLSGKESSVVDRSFEIHNETLAINNSHKDKVCIGCFNKSVDIVITTPHLEAVEAAHGTRVTVDEFETDSFRANVRYGSRGDITLSAEKINVLASHSSRIFLEGSADELTSEIKYSSQLDTSALQNEKTALEVRHSSTADIGETEVLDVVAKHSSSVRYVGEPELTQDVQHSSSLRKKF